MNIANLYLRLPVSVQLAGLLKNLNGFLIPGGAANLRPGGHAVVCCMRSRRARTCTL
jgi:hypothetical protein